MKLSINREALLEPLQLVSGVVERRQTLPVLSNLLFHIRGSKLTITASDQEVELTVVSTLAEQLDPFETTIPARKLLDICKSLKAESEIEFTSEANKVLLKSGRFKSHLATLPAIDFPKVEMESDALSLKILGEDLNKLLDDTAFAMAQQDVRYFFNGMLMEISKDALRTVATNGQRLAVSDASLEKSAQSTGQFIVPRKGIIELAKMVKNSIKETIGLQFSNNHLRVNYDNASLTTKLIDGSYPEYQKAIPENSDKFVTIDRLEFREALSRIAILTHEMYRNVKIHFSDGEMRLEANNPQQEDAEEIMKIDYEGEVFDIGFNVSYLLDVLATIKGDQVRIALMDGNSPVLIQDPDDDKSRFVVSPMML